MKVKKLLHLTHTYIPEDSRILKAMACAATSGYCVVGLGVNSAEKKHVLRIDENVRVRSFDVASRKLSFFPRFVRNCLEVVEITAKMLVAAVKEKPDIIHCNDTTVLPLAILIKLFTKSSVIYDAHELESDRNGLSKIAGRLTYFIEKILWEFIDGLIVVSPSIGAWYDENMGSKRRVIILNSPVMPVSSESFDESYLRRKFSIPQDELVFIYVGILGAGRGIELVLDVFCARHISSHVVFLGYGNLESEITLACELNPNVHFHSAVSHDEVVSIVSTADFGLCLIQNVSLSDYYCLPNKLFEYIFSGIPVVASNFPDIAELVNTYQVGVCCDLEALSIDNAIKEIEVNSLKFNFDLDQLHCLSWAAQEEKLSFFYNSF